MRYQLVYLIIFSVTFLVTTLVIPWVKALGVRYKLLDFPDNRKSKYHIPKVRIGGLAFFIGFITSIFLLLIFSYFNNNIILDNNFLFLIVIISAGFFGIGFTDDMFSLSPIWRLFLQYFLATFICIKGLKIEFLDLSILKSSLNPIYIPNFLSIILTSTWIVGIINCINWIDGLDGLAAGCSLIMFITLFLISYSKSQFTVSIISLIFSAICMGFLRFNFKPAKILMGDGGSYLLGFSLAYLTILSGSDPIKGLDLRVPTLILFYPLIDMVAVIVNRIKNKTLPIYPDKSHFHHRILKAVNNEVLTVSILYLITIFPCIIVLSIY